MSKKIDQGDIDWLLSHGRAPGEATGGPQATGWYKIEAKGKDKKATVYILDEISPWGSGARQFADTVAKLDVNQIELHINSPGGSFAEGIAIMNMLHDHKATVTAQVDGLAASAASIVAMGADTVTMKPGSQMMIHEGSGLVYGPMADMLKMAQILEKTNSQMAAIYADKAGGDPALWREAMNQETWYTDQEAVDAGLADSLDTSGKQDEVVAARTKWDLSVFAHAGREHAPAPYTPAEPPENHEEDEEMPNKQLVAVATALGVKDADKFADDDKLSEAITALKLAPVKEEPKPDEPKPDEKPPPTQNVHIPAGMVLLDAETITALQKDAADARSVVKEVNEQKRDTAIAAAITDGKIPASRLAHWQTFWDSDKEGAQAALAALPKNLVPLAPIGRGEDGGGGEADPDYAALYPEEANHNG